MYGTCGFISDQHEIRNGHAKPCGQATEGCDARVRPSLFDLDQHSLADAATSRQLVESLLFALAKHGNSSRYRAI
jgi:hypothetical protein